ncbi:MAG TPA: glycosyltransferase family 2 protein [Thermoanaerobaculia bacterium]|nr:glycosyltransferase family 2 protein [Thermoanaerobaculia bacterium]
MPAYNAAATIERVVAEHPAGWFDEVLVVDDASRDDTVEIARRLPVEVVVHPTNRGYGGNQKTCYREALARGADYVVMLHPDYQYHPGILPAALTVLRLDICDVVLGNRIRTRHEALAGGMPRFAATSTRLKLANAGRARSRNARPSSAAAQKSTAASAAAAPACRKSTWTATPARGRDAPLFSARSAVNVSQAGSRNAAKPAARPRPRSAIAGRLLPDRGRSAFAPAAHRNGAARIGPAPRWNQAAAAAAST